LRGHPGSDHRWQPAARPDLRQARVQSAAARLGATAAAVRFPLPHSV